MIFKNKRGSRFTTLLLAMVMIAMVILPATPVMAAADTAAYTAKAEALSQNIYNKYLEDGKVMATSLTELDGFAIYVLNKANVDVLAWEFEGKTVEEELNALIADAIAKEEADDTETFNAKQLAYLYLAADSSDKAAEATKLLNFLIARQANSTNGGFVDGDYSEYTNLPVFDILAMEEKLDQLENADKAFEYVRDLDPTTSEFPDLMAISQTARILKAMEVQLTRGSTNDRIKTNLEWLKTNQAEDGSFKTEFGDVATDTSEVLRTINVVGISTELTEMDRDNALDFLVEKDTFANIGANVWVLNTLLANGAKPLVQPTVPTEVEEPTTEAIKVDVALIDPSGTVIYGPKSLTLKSDDEFGLTALAALAKTELDYTAGYNNNLVTEIASFENEGLSGWMYAVNDTTPEVAAIEKTLVNGDKVLWFYSTSATAGVPAFPMEEAAEASFTDVGANYGWAKEAIEALAAKGIIQGTGDNKFEPARKITRAEFSKVIVEALDEDIVSGGTAMFSDVDSTKWYAEYVGKAAAKGLIEGSEGKFRPDDTITRNEVAMILHRMANKVAPSNPVLSFTDAATVPAWANDAVAYAVEKELVNGYPGNLFKGQDPMTRAEVAVVLFRYLGL